MERVANWNDYARDITHMINTLRPQRPLVGVGHSFGGATLVNVSLSHPRLFTTLVLLDPVIARYSANVGNMALSPATASIYRRDLWPTRSEARQAFEKSPFYKGWDKRVLDAWVKHGLTPTDEENPDSEVTLTTSKHQEVFTFLRPSYTAYNPEGTEIVDPSATPDIQHIAEQVSEHERACYTFPFYRPEPTNTTGLLPHLRPSTLYVFGGTSMLSPLELREEKLKTTGVGVGGSGGAAKGRVKAVLAEDNGHLIPMEIPQFCAQHAADWIQQELQVWQAEEDEYVEWSRKSPEEKSTVSEDYKKHAGKPWKPLKKEKAKI